MARLIDADKLQSQLLIRIDHCDKEHGNEKFVMGIEYAMEYVDEMPTIDAVPAVEVRHAYWEDHGRDNPPTCSNCGSRALLNYESDYCKSSNCPHCGAKMDKRGVKDD